MRVLLISSNLDSQFHAILPNGAASLSAYLKQEGYTVKVCHLERRGHFRVLARTLREFAPDVVGISANASEARHIATFASMAKEARPDTPVIAGGIHVSLVPESVICIPGIDVVCRGEGEGALVDYLEALEAGKPRTDIPNLWFNVDGDVIKNKPRPFIEDLDTLPFMDRGAIDYQYTIHINSNYITTMVGRGCGGECLFCANPRLRHIGTGKWVRMRSVDNVMEDLRQLRRQFSFEFVNFRDDDLCWNKEWLMELCEKFPQNFSWPFDCFSRCDSLDDEMIEALAEAGCGHVFLGLDTGNDFIRNDVLKKGTRNDTLIYVSEKLNQVGIKAVISNILGLPYETPERFRETIEVNRKIHKNQVTISSAYGAAPKLWVFNPWPGTPLYDLCEKEGWLQEIPRKHRIYRETYLNMPDFPPGMIYYYYAMFRYLVYKDSHPFFALLFRLYDHRATRYVAELLPGTVFARIRAFFAGVSLRLKPRNMQAARERKRKERVPVG